MKFNAKAITGFCFAKHHNPSLSIYIERERGRERVKRDREYLRWKWKWWGRWSRHMREGRRNRWGRLKEPLWRRAIQ
jgi:hypothetical protein